MNNNYDDCPKIIKDFLFYIYTIKGRSSKTVDAYYIDLRTFFRFINLHKKLVPKQSDFIKISIMNIHLDIIKEITISDVYEFLNYTARERSNSAKTRARKISSIKSFYNYLTNKVALLETNPLINLDTPKIKKSLPKYLTLEQCLQLLKNIDGPYKERDYCMITLFLNCGLRLSELVGLNLSDIIENKLKVVGKGNKERIIYMNNSCMAALSSYLKIRNSQKISSIDKNAIFLNRNGKRIGNRRVEQIIEENLVRAGLENYGISTHKLRHTAATMMYQHGNVDIRVLQEILGHTNLGTTEIYTHISDKQLEEASNKNPLADIKQKKTKE